MVQLRRLKGDEKLPELIESVNRIFDALLGNRGGRIALLDDDGELLDIAGGASLGTSEPSLKIRSSVGEHVLVEHSSGTPTLFEVQDYGVTINALTLSGNLHVGGDFDVDGNVALGNGLTDTTLIAGPATLNATLNVKGNTTLGDASTDTVLISGPLTIQDWLVTLATDDLIFKDDGGSEIVRFGDTASTWHLKVTGPAQVTGNLETGGNLVMNSSGFMQLGTTVASTGTVRGGTGLTIKVLNGGSDMDLIGVSAGFIAIGSGGAGGVLQVGAGTQKVRWDATGVGFNGSATVAKPVLGAAAGAAYTAAEQTLINNIRSCLQNVGLAT